MCSQLRLGDIPILPVLVLGLACAAAEGRILYVDCRADNMGDGTSWETPYRYLQDALGAAERGDRVQVAQGVYKPDQGVSVALGDRLATFQLRNGVLVVGGYGGSLASDPDGRNIELYRTVLSGDLAGNDVDADDLRELWNEPSRRENSYHVVSAFGTDASAVLDGFVITAGSADDREQSRDGEGAEQDGETGSPPSPPPANLGGAGVMNDMGDPTLISCTIVENVATGKGGGMANIWGNPTLIQCEFAQNLAASGGAISNYEGTITVRDCVFRGNRAIEDDGGAIEGGGGLVFTDCAFVLNLCEDDGGALFVTGDRTSMSLSRCSFKENSAGSLGGALYLYSGQPAALHDCAFVCNFAAKGGAVAGVFCRPTLDRCRLVGNSAKSMGGGIFCYGGRSIITQSTFVANMATSGSELACQSVVDSPTKSKVTFRNCILSSAGDAISNQDGSVVEMAYCAVQGGWPGQGNRDVDPCFVNPGYWDPNATPDDPNDDSWVDGDYHLKSQAGRWDPGTKTWVMDDMTSPCIDAGDPNSPVGYEPFPNGGRINMGAYGGTAEASKSYFGEPACETIIAGDINGDCRVDFADFQIMSRHWRRDESQHEPGP